VNLCELSELGESAPHCYRDIAPQLYRDRPVTWATKNPQGRDAMSN